MKNYILIFLLLISSKIFSQKNIQAKEILNNVSIKIDQAINYSFNFSYKINQNINEESKGSVIISEDKYFLDFLGVKQICYSNFLYTIVAENKEVIISKIFEENKQSISPSNILKFYKEGYEIVMDELKSESNMKIQYLKLIPLDENSEIDHILLGINNKNNDIYRVIEKGKNNSTTILRIDKINYDTSIDNTIFVFNELDYKGYYIEKN